MKKSIIVLLTAIGLTSSSLVFAKHHNPEKIITKITEKLELNSSQQAQFRAFIDEKRQLREQRKAYREAKKANPEQHKASGPFANLLEQDTISANDITDAFDKKHAERLIRRQNLFASFATFYNGLSEQQRIKIKPLMKRLLKSKKCRKKKGKK